MSLGNQTLQQYLAELSAKQSTPGGGAVAAISGAQASGLVAMVAEFSVKTLSKQERHQMIEIADRALTEFLQIADRDAVNFKKLMSTYQTKTGTQEALKNAAEPPLACLDLATKLATLVTTLNERGNRNLVTDTGIAALLLSNTIRASEMNVLINLRSISDDDFVQNAKQQLDSSKGYIGPLASIAANVTDSLSQ